MNEYTYEYVVKISHGSDRPKILKTGVCTGDNSEEVFTKISRRVRRQLIKILYGFEALDMDIPYVELRWCYTDNLYKYYKITTDDVMYDLLYTECPHCYGSGRTLVHVRALSKETETIDCVLCEGDGDILKDQLRLKK